MTQLSEERIGKGQLKILREMVRDHINREGDGSSFAMRSGLLLAVLLELEERREANS
jgi:hypothetical protein